MAKIENYIHGNKTSISKKTIDVYNPSTGEIISQVVSSDKNDFFQLIESSKKASLEWSRTTPLKRSRIISKYKNLIERNLNELAELVSMEHGKTLEDAIGSVTRGLEVVEFVRGIPHLLKGEFSQNVGTDIDFGLLDNL